jgi:hypothetical protein
MPDEKYLSLLFGLLGEKDGLDVGEDTSLSNGDSGQEFIQLFVITDSQLQVTGDDPGLLVVTGSIAGQFKNLSCQVFHNGSQVDRGTSSDTFSIVSLAEETMDTTNGELKSSTAGTRLCLSLDFSSFTTSRHVWLLFD